MSFFLLTLLVVALCVLGLCAGILLKKDGRFPQNDVGSNEAMLARGIVCYKYEDARLHQSCDGAPGAACKDCGLYKLQSSGK